jgi:hypothetical protein
MTQPADQISIHRPNACTAGAAVPAMVDLGARRRVRAQSQSAVRSRP